MFIKTKNFLISYAFVLKGSNDIGFRHCTIEVTCRLWVFNFKKFIIDSFIFALKDQNPDYKFISILNITQLR